MSENETRETRIFKVGDKVVYLDRRATVIKLAPGRENYQAMIKFDHTSDTRHVYHIHLKPRECS